MLSAVMLHSLEYLIDLNLSMHNMSSPSRMKETLGSLPITQASTVVQSLRCSTADPKVIDSVSVAVISSRNSLNAGG